MENLQSLELSVLVDMLVKHTDEYTTMMGESSSNSEQFDLCKLTIKAIQKEIETRKTISNTNTTDPNIILPTES